MADFVDDDADDDAGFPRVPFAPSVTPGLAPPRPDSVENDVSTRGCLTILAVGAALATIALVAAIALIIVGKGLFDTPTDTNEVLREVFIETGISSANTDADHPPQYDIKLGTCESDGDGGVRASGTLTNWTSDAADYVIDVSFRHSGPPNSGQEFASKTVLVEVVPEHATTNWEAVASETPDGAFACRIVAINRWPNGSAPPS